jgi:hypothetical protein
MNDLISLFRNFIYRDLAFILGGSMVVVSTLHAFGISLHHLQDQPYTLFLLTVLAYVVGYAVQDFGALLPFRPTYTDYVLRPGRLSLFLYWRFTGSGWEPLTFASSPEGALQFAMHMDRLNIPEATLRELDRILSLKVISMCVGGCSILSAVIFFVTWAYNRFASIDWIPSILLLALGLALICLGWVKALQQMQFYEEVEAEEYPLRKGQERTSNNDEH